MKCAKDLLNLGKLEAVKQKNKGKYAMNIKRNIYLILELKY